MTTDLRDLENLWRDQPGNYELFISLGESYAEALDWRKLVSLYENASARFGTDPEFGDRLVAQLRSINEVLSDTAEQGGLLVALGDALWSLQQNRDDAMKAFQESYVVHPSDTTCLDHARNIYRESEDFERVLLLFKLQLKKESNPQAKARVLTRVAQVYGDDMKNPAKAVEVLEQVMEHDPENADAEELFYVYSEGKSVLQVIQDLVLDAREHRKSHPERSAEHYVQATHLEKLRDCGTKEQALEYATEALNIEPGNEEAINLRSGLLEQLGRSDEATGVSVVGYVNVIAEEAERKADEVASEIAADTSIPENTDEGEAIENAEESEAVENAEEGAGNPDRDESEAEDLHATKLLTAIQREQIESMDTTSNASAPAEGDLSELGVQLDNAPGNLSILRAFMVEAKADGAHDALVTRYEEGIKRLRKKEGELDAMLDLSKYLWKDRVDSEAAEYWFKRIKLIDAEQPDMLAFYEEWFEKEEDWSKLFALLNTAQQHTTDDSRRLEITRRLASLAENEMQSADKAINVWKAYSRQTTDHKEARPELIRLYSAHEKWSALVDTYKEELSETEDAPRRLDLLIVMADLYEERLSLEPMVIMCLQQVLEIDPHLDAAFDRLRGLLENNRRFNDLTQLLAQRADTAADQGDIANAVVLYLDVASIWQDQLKNVTQALPFLERVVEIDPTNQPVIDRLKEVYESRRDFKSLFELMRREAALLDGDERLEKLKSTLRLAQERVRDPELIAPLLKEILEAEPSNQQAMEQLETLLRRSNDAPQLAELLLQKAAHADEAESHGLKSEAAKLLAPTDPDIAVEIWTEILDANPQHEEAFVSLSEVLVRQQNWDGVGSLYSSAKRHDALWELFDAAAGVTDDDEARASLYRRMATIAAENLDAPSRVILSLEALREVSANPDDIVRELVQWYERIGDVEHEIAMHRRLFDTAAEPGTKFKEAVKIRSLELSRDEHGNAMQWSLEAVRIDPCSSEALDLAYESASAADALELLVSSLDDIAQTIDDPAAQELIWGRLATIEQNDLNRIDDAIAHIELLSERLPDDLELLGKLDELYALSGNGTQRIATLRRQIEILMDRGATRVDVIDELGKIADVQRSELGQKDDARATYAEILDIEPEHLISLRGLKELHREDERWDDVVECLLREVSLSSTESPELRNSTLLELGDVYREHLNEPGDALRHYAMVLADDGTNVRAVAAVEALLAQPDQARDAALLLEPIFRDVGRQDELVQALEARRAVTEDRFEEQEILDELIPLYIGLENVSTAFDRACRQVELDVERSEVWLRLEQLGAKLNRWGDIEKVFSKFAPTDTKASATRFDMLRHLAAIREYQLNMKAEALAAWELLYAYDPMESAHVEALERLYRQLGRHEDLVHILVAKADLLEEPNARAMTLGEAARISDEVLADSTKTIEILQKLLLADSESREAVTSLRRLLASEARYLELGELLSSQGEMCADPELRKSLNLDLARTRFNHLDDVTGAIETLQLVLSENPHDSEVLGLIDSFDESLAGRPEMIDERLDLLAIAEPVARAQQNDSRLTEILRVKLAAEESEFEKVVLLDEISELLVNQERFSEAFDATADAVALTPDDEVRRQRIEDLGNLAERERDVVSVLRQAAAKADSVSAADIFVRVAGILERLGDDSEAMVAFEEALSANESDERALLALENLYERHQRYEDLASVLKRSATFGDPSQRATHLRRLAMVEEEVLNHPEESLEAWIELAELEPDAADALDALERLHERAERWMDVAEILERKASTILIPEVQLGSWLKLAAVRENHLDDVPGAIQTLNQVLTSDPSHDFATNELERLYQQESQWDDLCDILRLKLAGADSDSERDRIELQLAHVLVANLFATEDALTMYRSVLNRSPGQSDAIRALEELSQDDGLLDSVAEDLIPHFAHTHQWQKLVALYERLLDRALDPGVQATYAHEIALVYRDGLEDFPAARKGFSRAWLLDLDNVALRNELLELVVRDSDWALLADTFNSALLESQDPTTTLDLHLRLAQLQHDHLSDLEAAEKHLREALLLDERHSESYDDIERLLVAQERWFDLVELLEARYSAFAMESDAVDILHRMARVQDQLLEDEITATDTYVRILSLAPDAAEALSTLNRLYRSQERWDDLNQLLVGQLSFAKPEDQVTLRLELGELSASHLHTPMQAVDYAREIFEIEPANNDAVVLLEKLVENEVVRADVAALLEPIYRTQGNIEGLLRALHVAADAADEPTTKAAFLKEVAAIQETEQKDISAAATAYERVFALTPEDDSVRQSLERIAAQTNGWASLAEAYTRTLRDNFDISDDVRATLLLEQASILESRLERLEDAERALSDLLLIQPEHEGALDALERILSRNENWHGLGELYRRRADLTHSPEDKRLVLETLAGLYEDVLEDSDSAVEIHNEILSSNADDVGARRALERLLHFSGRWIDLADLYRQQSEFARSPEESLEYRFRLAQILETELDQLDEALELHREILGTDPGHVESRRALEGLSRDLATREGDWAEHRVQIIDLLLTTYDPERDRERILSFLEQKATLVEDVSTKVALYAQLAATLESSSRSEDRSQALTYLAQAFQFDPYADDLRTRVDALAEELGAWERLVPIYLHGLERTDDLEAQIRLLRSCAEILSGPMKDRESAIAVWQQILALDKNHDTALGQLERLYGELELWEPLVEVLDRRVEAIYDQVAQERILKRIATIQVDVLGDSVAGIKTWRRLLDMNPARLEYVQQLETLCEQESHFTELEELLRLKVNLVDDGTPRLSVLRKLANVQDDVLRDVNAGIETWIQIRDSEPNDFAAAQALVRLYETAERWPELLDGLGHLRNLTTDRRAISHIELKTASVLLQHLEAPYDALSHVRNVLDEFPASDEARAAMATLIDRPGTREDAAAALENVYRATEEWRELEALFERLLEVSEDSIQREGIYIRLAKLQEEEIGQLQLAFVTFGRALRERPTSPEIRTHIEEISSRLNNQDELVAVYEDCLDALEDDIASRRTISERLGVLYFEIEEHDDAIRNFETVLEIDEYDAAALDYLDKLYQMTRRWDALESVLERELTIAHPSRVNDVRFRLGYLREIVFERPLDGFDHYRQIAIEEPTHGGALEAIDRLADRDDLREDACALLEPIYEQAQVWDKLSRVLLIKLEYQDHASERAITLERLGQIEAEKLNHPTMAYSYYGRSLREEPGNIDVQARLEELAFSNELYEELVALYEDINADLSDPIRIVDLSLVAGRVATENLGDLDGAVKLYQRVLDIDAENRTALDALEVIARHQGDSGALARVLQRKADALFDPVERFNTFVELGRVRNEREEFEEAIEAYQQASLIDESDSAVMFALVDLLEITEQYGPLVELLQRLVLFVEDDAQRFQLYVRMGQYQRVLLKDDFGALESYRAALDCRPDDSFVLESMDELYEATSNFDELREVLLRRLELSETPEARLALLVRSATLNYEKFSDVARAIEDFEAAMKIDANDPAVVAALDKLYRAEGRWDDVVSLYNRVISESSDSPTRVAQLRVTMADIYAQHMAAPEKAIEQLTAVLNADPGHTGALSVLADLHEAGGEWAKTIEVLGRQAEAAKTSEDRAASHLRRAQIFESKLNDPGNAANDYVKVIELFPTHEVALPALKALYHRLDAQEQLFAILEFEAAYRPETERVEIYLNMANIARDHLDDAGKRVAALEKASALAPGDLSVVEPLLDAFINAGAFDRAEPLLESIIQQLRDDRKLKDVVRFLHLQGKLAEQKGDSEAAFEAYEGAHKVDASYIPNLLSLGRMLFHKQDWDGALKMFQTLLLHQMNIDRDQDKVDVYYYLGMVRWHQGDPRRAKDMFSRALSIDPKHEPTKQAMSQL